MCLPLQGCERLGRPQGGVVSRPRLAGKTAEDTCSFQSFMHPNKGCWSGGVVRECRLCGMPRRVFGLPCLRLRWLGLDTCSGRRLEGLLLSSTSFLCGSVSFTPQRHVLRRPLTETPLTPTPNDEKYYIFAIAPPHCFGFGFHNTAGDVG